MNPADYGLDDDALATVETEGAKLTPEPKRKGPRPTSLDAAKAALAAGEPIPFLRLGSAQNPAATDKAWRLWGLYAGTDYKGLEAFAIGGSNTYARLLKGYKAILMESCAAGIEPAGEVINDLTVAWDAEQEAKRAARKANRKPRTPKAAEPAAPGPYAAVSTETLESKAAALESKVSAGRKTEERATLDAWRAEAKAMRKELASRLTPEDKAASKALAEKIRTGKPTEAAKAKVERAQAEPVKDAKLAPVEPKAEKPAKAKAAPKPRAAKDTPPDGVILYKSQFTARAGAKKELGDDVVEGVDYVTKGGGKKWWWLAIGQAV